MDPSPPSKDRFHLILFLLLSLLFVVCGAHILETISYSIGLIDAKPLNLIRNAGTEPVVRNPWYIGYRIAIPVFSLFFGYHCFSLREWARRLLVGILLFDLGIWLSRSLFFTLLAGRGEMPLEKLAVQLLVVFLEGGLVWILTHPETKKYFSRTEKRVGCLPHE